MAEFDKIGFDSFIDPTKGVAALKQLKKGLKSIEKELIDVNKQAVSLKNTLNKDVLKSLENFQKQTSSNTKGLKQADETLSKVTKKYQDQAKAVDKADKELKEVRKTQKEVNDIEKEAIRLGKERERLNAKLSTDNKKSAKENAVLKVRQQAVNKELKEGAKRTLGLVDQYTKLARATLTAKKRAREYELTLGKTSKAAINARKRFDRLDKKLRTLDKSFGDSQRDVGAYSKAFEGLGSRITALAGPVALAAAAIAGVGLVVRKQIELFREFGLTMSKVQAVSGATTEEFEALEKLALDLGETTQFTATQVAELELELSKLGFLAPEIQASADAILNFATATDSDLGEAAKVVASTLNAFNLEADQAGRIADVAAKAFSSSALDIQKFSTAIAIVGPAAEASGVSIEKTTAILGKIVDAGIDASSAGSALRNIFIDIEARGVTLEDTLKDIAGAQNKLTKANELFGKRGAVVAKVIADNIDSIDELAKSLDNAEGSAAKAAATIQDNLEGDIRALNSAFEGLLLSGEGLNSFFRGIIQFATTLTRGLNNLINGVEDLEKKQRDLNDANLEIIKTTKINIDETTELASRYEELANKESLSVSEKKELDLITIDLISRFGDSVVAINAETGAFEINILAIKKKIQIEQALQSSAAKALIGEQLRLETQLKIAKGADAQLAQLKEQFKSSEAALKLIEATRKGVDELADAEDGLTIAQVAATRGGLAQETDAHREAREKEERVVASLTVRLGSLAKAIENEATNKTELEKINQQLLDSGLDLTALAEEQIAIAQRLAGASGNEAKALRTRAELVEILFTLTKQLNIELAKTRELQSPEEINRLNAAIKRTNDLINEGLTNERKFHIEKKEFRKEEDIDTDKAIEKRLEEAKREIEIEDKKQKELERLRKEAAAAEKQRRIDLANDPITQAILKGVESRIASEYALAAAMAFRQSLERGESVQKATVNAAKAIAAALITKAFVESSGFHDGGYTGDGGEYQVAGPVHKGEFVLDKKQTSKYGFIGSSASDFDKAVDNDYFSQFAISNNEPIKQAAVIVNNGIDIDYTRIGKEVGKNIPHTDFSWVRGHMKVTTTQGAKRIGILFKDKSRLL